MYLKNVIALGALVASVAAIPMHQHHMKRDVIWKTVTDIDITTITTTTTIWGASPAAATPTTNTGVAANHRQKHKHHTKRVKSTVTVVPSPAETSPPTTSPYVTPTPATTPSTPTQTPAPAPTTQPSSGTPSSGQHFTGDITYYTPGLGSCGITSTDTDMIVALAEDLMTPGDGANPNKNPLCGSKITISYGGVQAQATVVDTCPGCSGHSLDLSPSLFQKFAQLSTGRVSGVQWWYD